MTKNARQKPQTDSTLIPAVTQTSPLVFISHDSRDGDLAEAFSKLLKSVSAGMIKTFYSSEKTGANGIDFCEEWYKYIMDHLQSTSDVVCLFTERSLERPWILFEAGVAKGKLDTPVIGVALGIPLTRVNSGPFYQFMNTDDSEDGLTKLVGQLARKVPGLELDTDVVKNQVTAFKSAVAGILKNRADSNTPTKSVAEQRVDADENAVAKLAEEMKTLPARIVERLSDTEYRRRRPRRTLHPMMLEELMHTMPARDPVNMLIAAALYRDDFPWLYELALEVYRAAKTGPPEDVMREMRRVRHITEITMRSPIMEELASSKEAHFALMEFPRMLERTLMRSIEGRHGDLSDDGPSIAPKSKK